MRTRDPCSKKTALAISNSFLLTLVRITWGLINRFLGSTTEFPGEQPCWVWGPHSDNLCSKVSLKRGTEHFLFFFVGGGTVTVLVHGMLSRIPDQSLRQSATTTSHPPHTTCYCQLAHCQSPVFLTRQCHCH